MLVSSFPNRKLNLRFGFFYANLQQPLSLGCAEPAPLGGEPKGGAKTRRCDPSLVPYVAKKIADLRGIPAEEVARATESNARRVFRL